MHSLCAQYYSTWHKRLGIPVVLLGGITASSVFSSVKNSSEIWGYANGAFVLIITALAGVSNFLGIAEKTTKHQNASIKYSKIGMDIDTILSFGRNERIQTPQEFIQAKKTEMLDIRENTPEVLPWVMSNYLKKFDKSLTDIKSKVNKERRLTETPGRLPHSFGPTTFVPDSEEIRSGASDTTHVNTCGGTPPHIPPPPQRLETPPSSPPPGQLLNDFIDASSSRMTAAGEMLLGAASSCSENEADEDIETGR